MVYIEVDVEWAVNFTGKAAKQVRDLPRRERDLVVLLVRDLALRGPVMGGWRNYSKLGGTAHHCHLSYRWVACWRARKEDGAIDIYYLGSRENAPY